jgi:cyclophilin family peptidyl-prolyl cis-trans isomerase
MNRALLLGTLALATPALADTAVSGTDPVANHTIALEDATKGLKGSGPLVAKMDVEQGGKPLGTFTCELYDKQAPKTVANFVGLSRGLRPWKDPKTGEWTSKPLYNGLVFHRVIPGFMVQGGGMTPDLKSRPTGKAIKNEASAQLRNDRGTLAMARTSDINSATSQFFINLVDNEFLNHRNESSEGFGYCAFGQVTAGLDVVDAIAKVRTGSRGAYEDVPVTPVEIRKIRRE